MRLLIKAIVTLALALPLVAQAVPPSCYPKPLGTVPLGGTVTIEGEGRADWWWCPGKDYPAIVAKSDAHRLIVPNVDISKMTAKQLGDSIWNANVALDCKHESIRNLCKQARARAEAQRPWIVAKNGDSTTRPMRNPDMTASKLRATVGEPCDCKLGVIKNGNQNMCELARLKTPELVACVRKPL